MPRVPDETIERLKREVSVERLAEARGVKLARHGADLLGLCPFHDDHEPSLVVSPKKNLWHCLGACQAGGTSIDWVMKAEGVSFRHAVELLRADVPVTASSELVKTSTVRKLPPPVERGVDDARLLEQIAAYYHETLKQSPEALEYLAKRGLTHSEMVARFRLGYANRTLGLRLPAKNRRAGEEMRAQMQRLGVIRESGHEHLNGSLVIPVFSLAGEVMQMYGRKINGEILRPGTPAHLYLPGLHRGVWNEEALQASQEIILCESLIDALTFWCAGFRNVTASYGVNGFTDDHREALHKHGVRQVWIAYDRDEAGDKSSLALAEELMAMGIDCYRILFPKGMDANEYALKVTPAEKSLGLLINQAQWLGKGKPPERAKVEKVEAPAEPAAKEKIPEPVLSLAASSAAEKPAAEVNGEEIAIAVGDRRYRVRGLARNQSYELLKVNLLASHGDGFHVDTLDLYSARQRAVFIKQAAIEMGLTEDAVKHDR